MGPRTLRIRRADVDRLAPATVLDEDPAFAAFLRRLNQPVTAEEIARRTEVAARILAHREKLDIRPLTTADLIHQAREKSVYDDQSN